MTTTCKCGRYDWTTIRPNIGETFSCECGAFLTNDGEGQYRGYGLTIYSRPDGFTPDRSSPRTTGSVTQSSGIGLRFG